MLVIQQRQTATIYFKLSYQSFSRYAYKLTQVISN